MSSDFFNSFPLRNARVHEASGPSASGFAAIVAAQVSGDIMWVRETWVREVLHPVGLASTFDPERLLVAQTGNQIDSLAVAEEALKDGALALVVIEITRPLDLREGRRLQLAAKAGNTVGLCLIPEGMGSNAAETRWRAAPLLDVEREDSTLMRWEIIKNKSGTIGAWDVRWDRKMHRLHVVSPIGQRSGSQDATG